MDPLGGIVMIFAQSLQVLGVQALNRHLVVELVYKGVVHDIRDPILLGELGEFITTGRVRELLRGDSEKESFLKIMNGQGVDTDVVEGLGVDGIHLGDVAGVDRAIDQEVLGNFAFEKSNSVIIMLFFRREEFVIISAQKDGDLAGVGGDSRPCILSPLVGGRE